MTSDAFGTAALRAAVLQAWATSPARLREDANTEEDHARGYYRDRVIVELAQNAADAASRAGGPGHLLLRLTEADGRTTLTAANTGAPLDSGGVASLASLRASAKRDGRGATSPVGRFGVGFAAVRSVADEVSVLSSSGGVRFSLAATAAELDALAPTHPGLAAEVRRREGSLPALRLPRPDDARPPTGYDTAVVLELRDAAAATQVRALLAAVGDPLLLALPALAEIVVEIDAAGESSLRRLADVGSRWTIARGAGTLDLALLADRPVEERTAREWSVTWALPLDSSAVASAFGGALGPRSADVGGGDSGDSGASAFGGVQGPRSADAGGGDSVASAFGGVQGPRSADVSGGRPARGAQEWGGVVHAPTPTDEHSALPALLVATLPLDPSRRHVVRGVLTDAVLDHAADVYADLASRVAQAGGDPLALVPVGLPAGALDGDLSERIVDRLSRTPLLVSPDLRAPEPTSTFGGALTPRSADAGGGEFGASAFGGALAPRSADAGGGDSVASAFGGALSPRSADAATEEELGAGGRGLVEPRRAVALAGGIGRDPQAIAALSRWAANLVVLGPGQEAPARILGVEVRELADLIEELPTAAEPQHWRDLYAALSPAAADPAVREALGALPVLLADGRIVRGARGLVLPAGGGATTSTTAHTARTSPAGVAPSAADHSTSHLDVLARWGLRLVDPAVAHPLLERLGAAAPEAGGLLLLPAVREAVLEVADDDDLALAADVADAVLTLVAGALADAHVPTATAAWLGELTLRDAAGEPTPASGLVLGGSTAAELLDERVLAPVAPDLVETWGAAVLVAAGVRDHLAVVQLTDVLVEGPGENLLGDDGPDDLATRSLDGWDDYLELLATRLGAGVLIGELCAVADLDAVRDDAWTSVLGHLAADPDLRRALLEPARAEGGNRTRVAPSYTAWWLRTRTPTALGLGDPFALPSAPSGLRELLAPVPSGLARLDPAVLGAIGGVAAFAELDGEAWADLLDELGPVGTPVAADVAGTLWRALADAAEADVELDRVPERLPALVGPGQVHMVHADDAAVAPAPMWLQRSDVAALVPAPTAVAARLATLLDLPLADELGDGGPPLPDDDGSIGPTPDAALALAPGAPTTWIEHDDLHVDGAPVDWWVEGDGPDAVVHATQLAALARGLAQAAGRWELRHALELALTEPGRASELRTEAAFDRT